MGLHNLWAVWEFQLQKIPANNDKLISSMIRNKSNSFKNVFSDLGFDSVLKCLTSMCETLVSTR